MTFSDLFPSDYLTQDDFPAPRTLVIARVAVNEVRQPNGKVKKAVLYFQGDKIKPMILNKTNGLTLADLYGRYPDGWVGKALEVYADPSVMMKGKKVGGIRVKAPSQKPATNGKAPGKPPLTIDQKHEIVLNGYREAKSEARLEEFAAWANNFDFSPHHHDEQSDAYQAALERLGLTGVAGGAVPGGAIPAGVTA